MGWMGKTRALARAQEARRAAVVTRVLCRAHFIPGAALVLGDLCHGSRERSPLRAPQEGADRGVFLVAPWAPAVHFER